MPVEATNMGERRAGGGRAGLDTSVTAVASPSTVAVAAEGGQWVGTRAKEQEAAQVMGLPAHTAPMPMALPVAALSGCCCHIGHIGTQGGHDVVAQAGTALLVGEELVRAHPGTEAALAIPPWWAQGMWLSQIAHASSDAARCHTHS